MMPRAINSFRQHLLLLLFSFFCLSFVAFAQDQSLYQKHWFVHKADTLPYRLLLPEGYNAAKAYPVIVFLHGSGERGSDNELQLVHGSKFFLTDSIRRQYPAIVVFPQCPSDSYWSNVNITYDSVAKKRLWNFPTNGEPSTAMRLLLGLLEDLKKKYKPSKNRWYIGGLSMGGMGTFEVVRRKPKMFAAAFPICGGANVATASALTKTNWWIFHGMKDDVVPPELSRQMADAIKLAGGSVRLTLYPNANHNSWDAAFAEKDLAPWLFTQHK